MPTPPTAQAAAPGRRRPAPAFWLACCLALALGGEWSRAQLPGTPPTEPPTTEAQPTEAQPTEAPLTETPPSPESDQPAASRDRQAAEDGLPRPSGPDTTIWIGGNGTPRPVVGLSYDELLKAWRALQQLDTGPKLPAVLRDRIDLSGTVEGDRVRITARYEFTLSADGHAEAPLGLAGAVLVDDPKITGESPKGQHVDYRQGEGGFVAWLHGKAGERRVVELPLLVPLTQDDQQTVLRLNLPRATRSEVVVESARRLTQTFVTGAPMLDTEAADSGGSRLRVRGGVGMVQLGWRSKTDTVAAPATVLTATSEIACRVDGTSVRSRAEVTVSSYGGMIERFRVRLPAGSSLRPRAEAEGQPRVTMLEAGDRSQRVCLVSLPSPTNEPVSITLETDQTLPLAPESAADLGGFEVLGVARQRGVVAIEVAEGWRAQLGGLDRVAKLPPEALPASLQTPRPTAAVEFFGQPFRLGIRVQRQPVRTEVATRYLLILRPDSAELGVAIDYRITGQRRGALVIDLADWAGAEVLSPSLTGAVGTDAIALSGDDDSELSLALPADAGPNGTAEFTLKVPLSIDKEQLQLKLPTAQATLHSGSELLVVADPSLELTPDAERLQRMRATAVTADTRDPRDPTGLQSFRFLGSGVGDVFAARVRRRPAEATVAVGSQVRVGEQATLVKQTFDYDLRHAAFNELRFSVPSGAIESSTVAFNLTSPAGDQPGPTPARRLEFQAAEPDEEDANREVSVALPRPWIGACRIEAEFSLPAALDSLERGEPISAPLISPIGSEIASSRVVARAEDGSPLTLGDNAASWSSAEDRDEEDGALVATGVGEAWVLPLRRADPQARTAEAILIRSARWETWITPTQTQQSAEFIAQTSAEEATIEIDPSLADTAVEVTIDGRTADRYRRTGNRLIVRLTDEGNPPDRSRPIRHNIALRYFEPGQSSPNSVAWRPPRMEGDYVLATTSWDIVLPGGLTPLAPPVGFAAVGSTESGGFGQATRLRFGGLGTPPQDQATALRLVSQPFIALAVSTAVLAAGLALIYAPWLRTPPALVAMVAALVAIGLWFPGQMVWLARAGVAGAALAAAAGFLAWLLRPVAELRPRSQTPIGGAMAGPGTDTLILAPLSAVSTNAPTASMPPADSEL
ncbi:MAG: hypothetical protein AAGJ46_00785 [Planctomycetota bacterium]